MSTRKALVIGATGLVGKALISHLLDNDYYEEIVVFTRRELALEDGGLKVVRLEDLDQLNNYASYMNVADVYCSLGTTRKKAGSKDAFIKVDYEYPLELAKLAMKQPAFEQFLVVTSIGANSESPLFYNMVKGRLEDALVKLNMKSLKIFQPSLLIGNRDEFRFWEEAAKVLSSIFSFFIVGSRRMFWAIRGEDVARSMFMVATKRKEGVEKYTPSKMINLIYP